MWVFSLVKDLLHPVSQYDKFCAMLTTIFMKAMKAKLRKSELLEKTQLFPEQLPYQL